VASRHVGSRSRAREEGRTGLPRIRIQVPALALLIGGAMLCAERAIAQTTTLPPTSPSLYDPLAPPDGKKKPYQTFDPQAPTTPAKQTTRFTPAPPASGAGRTGFNSANTKRSATPPPTGAAAERRTAPGLPAPFTPLTPAKPVATTAVQAPASTSAPATSAFAQSGRPGQPPVQVGAQPRPPRPKKKEPPLDPYDPLGYRQGGLLYYPAIELIAGYDSNPEREPNGSGAKVFTVAPELKVRSDWTRHEFKADLRGSYNWYSPDEVPSLNRPYVNAKADGRIDVTRDTRIDLDAKLLVSTDNPNSPNLQAGLAELPVYATFGGSAGLGHKFNRLDLSLKGAVERTVYQNSELVNGTTASNEDRNYNQYAVIGRAGYELRPGLTPFVEVQADTRKHDLPVDFFGFRRDSDGLTGKVGSTFELSRLLTGEVAVGYTYRTYDDPRLDTLGGFIGNASLLWTATALTNVRLTASSTVGESNVVGVSGILYRDVGLEVQHAFRRWLIGFAKAGYGNDDYVGSERTDNRYYLGAGITYKINRNWQLKGEYRHEWLDSSFSGNDYSADIFLAGLRWQY
jgi:hypothetical protein